MGDFQSVSNVLVKKEDLYGVLFLTLDRKLKMTCVKVGKFLSKLCERLVRQEQFYGIYRHVAVWIRSIAQCYLC